MTSRNREITGDDLKDILKTNFKLTNEVLEIKEELSQVYENYIKMVHKSNEIKIERLTLVHQLAEENKRYNSLKDHIDLMNRRPPSTCLIDLQDNEKISQENTCVRTDTTVH